MEFKEDSFSKTLGYYFPMPLRVVGVFVILGNLLAISLAFNPLSLLLLPFAVVLIFTKKELQIDFTGKAYREALCLPGIKFGGWEKFPAFEYVSVFKAKIVSTMASRGSQSNIAVEEVQVNLIYARNKKIEAAEFEDKEKAFSAATYFAQKLGLKILDATQKPFVWLE